MASNNRKNMGKVFEKEFKDSVPDNVYLERYKDDTSGFYGVSNPADFRLYVFPMLILLELKTHKGKSLPLAKIRENQLKGMLKAVEHYGVYGGYLVNFRDLEETYFLSVGYVENFYYDLTKPLILLLSQYRRLLIHSRIRVTAQVLLL